MLLHPGKKEHQTCCDNGCICCGSNYMLVMLLYMEAELAAQQSLGHAWSFLQFAESNKR